MKSLKLSFLAILIALVVTSCGEDSNNPLEPEKDPYPTTVTIVATDNGIEVDRKVITESFDKFEPAGYTARGTYNESSSNLSFNFENNGADYTCQFSAEFGQVTPGTYTFTQNDGKLVKAGYENKEIGTEYFTASKVTLVITRVELVDKNGLGVYYTSGNITMVVGSENNATKDLKVVATFKDVPVNTL